MKFLTLILTLILIGCASAPASLAKPLEKIKLSPNNGVMINSNIDLEMARTFSIEASFIRSTLPIDQTMYIILYSNGGITTLGYKMADAISILPNTKIICAFCASAAGMIFIGSGQPALATAGSEMMMHEMKWVLNVVELKEISQTLDEEESKEDEFNSIHYSRMNMTKEEYLKHIRGKNWFVKGNDLKKLHLADEMVEVECTESMRLIYPENCRKLENK